MGGIRIRHRVPGERIGRRRVGGQEHAVHVEFDARDAHIIGGCGGDRDRA